MRLFLLMITLCMCFSIEAQTFKKQSNAKFEATSGLQTNEVFIVDDYNFNIFKTKKGSKYIILESQTGNTYACWIHEKTKYKYNNKSIYKTKKGSYCIYKINSHGNPYPVWLEKLE